MPPDHVYRSVKVLAGDITETLRNRPSLIVSVDGFDGSGKTTLCRALSPLFDANVVELDHFVTNNMGGYLANIRYEELARYLERLRRNERPTLVEGVCILVVLKKLEIAPSLTIYVKRLLAGTPYWLDGRVLKDAKTAEEALAHEEEKRRFAADADGESTPSGPSLISGLTRELIVYHFEYRPHERADYVYARNSN